jgi:excisionase family DNA binding protein
MQEGDDVYYTTQEVADRLSVSRSTIYSWIKKNKLRATRAGDRLLRISNKDLANFLISSNNPSGVVITRRKFVKRVRNALITFTASVATSSMLQVEIEEAARMRKRSNEAKELFGELFSTLDPRRPFDYSIGQPGHWCDLYNGTVARKLSKPLRLLDHKPIVSPSPLGLNIQRTGDLVLIGGPISTNETMIAWEYEGPNNHELKRPDNP